MGHHNAETGLQPDRPSDLHYPVKQASLVELQTPYPPLEGYRNAFVRLVLWRNILGYSLLPFMN